MLVSSVSSGQLGLGGLGGYLFGRFRDVSGALVLDGKVSLRLKQAGSLEMMNQESKMIFGKKFRDTAIEAIGDQCFGFTRRASGTSLRG